MNDEEQEVQNTESVNTLYQLLPAGDLDGEDLMYLMQGLGSDRDRKLSLSKLLEWIASNVEAGVLENVIFNLDHDTYRNFTFIDGDGLDLENVAIDGNTLSEKFVTELRAAFLRFKKSASGQLRETEFDADGLKFKHGSGNNNVKCSIVIDLSSDKIVISDPSGIVVEGLLYASDGLEVANGKNATFPVIITNEIKHLKNNAAVTDMQFTDTGLGITGRVSIERFNFNASEIISEQYASSSINLYSHSFSPGPVPAAGDTVVIKNAHTISESQKVYIEPNFYVTIAPMCCMAFICTGVLVGVGYRWMPLGNAEVTYEAPSA